VRARGCGPPTRILKSTQKSGNIARNFFAKSQDLKIQERRIESQDQDQGTKNECYFGVQEEDSNFWCIFWC